MSDQICQSRGDDVNNAPLSDTGADPSTSTINGYFWPGVAPSGAISSPLSSMPSRVSPRERGHPACPGLFNDRVRPVNHPTVARTNIERPHAEGPQHVERGPEDSPAIGRDFEPLDLLVERTGNPDIDAAIVLQPTQDRTSTRLNSSH